MSRGHGPWIAFGAAAMALGVAGGVPWILSYRAASVPLWPFWVFAAIAALGLVSFLIGVALSVSGGLHQLAEPHEQMVDQIARRAQPLIDRDPVAVWHTDAERQMLGAHHPQIAEGVEDVRVRCEERDAAWNRLDALLRTTAEDSFPTDGFWQIPAIREQAARLVRGQEEHVSLDAANAIQWRRVTPQLGMTLPQVNWGQLVVWWPTATSREAASTDDELQERIDVIAGWFRALSDSAAAAEYRGALRDLAAARERLVGALDPVVHLAPMRWSRRCLICNPKRRWQFGR